MSNRPKSKPQKKKSATRERVKPLPLVDSRERVLDIVELTKIVLSHQNKSGDPRMYGLMLAAEMQMENSDMKQIGNTIFIVHPLPNQGEFLFRALNADTAANFADNVFKFVDTMVAEGYHLAVTQFDDARLIKLVRIVGERYMKVLPGVGYKIGRLPTGAYRAFIKIGNKQ